MPASDAHKRFPLRLCEVLEQEFSALHGQRKDWPTWLLRPQDLKAKDLARHLRDAASDRQKSPARHLHARLRGLGLDLDRADLDQQGFTEVLGKALNTLLQCPEPLYPLECLRLDNELKRLSELHCWPQNAAGGALLDGTSEHVQLNRLLLEAALPEHLVTQVDNARLEFLFQQVHALPKPQQAQAGPQTRLPPQPLQQALPVQEPLPEGEPEAARQAEDPPEMPRQPQLHQQPQAGPIQGQSTPKPLLRSALCLSGGGIRSAAFALGGVQALACRGVLDKFDYLSTVSGGGYLGSWLSTWIHRHQAHVHGVTQALHDSIHHQGNAWESKLKPEVEPVRFLRTYSHFLNARAGLFSLDTWTWVGLYLRNLSLNWLVLIPLLLLLLMLPRVFSTVALGLKGTPAMQWVLLALASVAGVLMLLCTVVNRPSASDTARQVQLTPGVQPIAQTLRERLLRGLKQPSKILALGILPLLIFANTLAWLVWVKQDNVPALQAMFNKALAWAGWDLKGDMLALGVMLAWGGLIIFLAWLPSFWLLHERPDRERWGSLGLMLAGGLLTWLLLWELGPLMAGWQPVFKKDSVWSSLRPLQFYIVLGGPAVVLAVLAGMTLFIGLVSKWKWVEDEDREWWARFGAWALIIAVGWIALAAVVVLGPVLLLEHQRWLPAAGGLSGLVGVLLGKSALSPAGRKGPPTGKSEGWMELLRNLAGGKLTTVLAAVFLVFFLAVLSLVDGALLLALRPFTSKWDEGEGCKALLAGVQGWHAAFEGAAAHGAVMACAPWPAVTLAVLALGVVLAGAGFAINLNKFSLHAAYRIRIARTFLGASRGKERKPNPFTGFDPMDNVEMHELQPGLLREADLLDTSTLASWLRTALQPEDAPAPTASPRMTPAALAAAAVAAAAAGATRHAGSTSLQRLIAARPPSPMPMEEVAAAVKRLAELVCAPPYEPKQRLRQDLLASRGHGTVLASVVQLLMESLNRVLESVDLAALDEFKPFVPTVSTSKSKEQAGEFKDYCARGQRIFANRLLLERVLGDQLLKFAFPPPPPHKLMHVVNLTLNLVRGRNLAWQERKAAPFTVSPMHSGNYYLGYRASRDYGAGISIATAAAVSGAAVSPNMGYSSSPVTALLLTLFNVRLGWWLGNPGTAGGHTTSRKPWVRTLRERVGKTLPPPYRRKEPFFSLHPVISEALGNTDDSSHYVYLSDGGHFENLGLYEMVLRRCHFIVVFDAGADPEYQFDDLGNAVRKIRIDLGIPIEVEPMPIHKAKDADDRSGRYCALGRIRYSQVDGADAPDGLLLYFKPVLRGTEPRDVQHYVAQNRDFPQESTSDQFFGEAQFESYRSLGQWAVEQALSGYQPYRAGWAAELAQRAHAHIHDPGAFRRKPKLAPWLVQWQSRFEHCQ